MYRAKPPKHWRNMTWEDSESHPKRPKVAETVPGSCEIDLCSADALSLPKNDCPESVFKMSSE